ncbi:ABC transporter permease subunit [uncultured Arthrobacter sp.]|uniref:ABC transporter permease subunit n=1 Tax=uncultured Arthrobacter sp. TaxID=114050 RepID=UPI00262AE345|nr:ABC transporter permease subunit [uncultured Arthrobacter sp.]
MTWSRQHPAGDAGHRVDPAPGPRARPAGTGAARKPRLPGRGVLLAAPAVVPVVLVVGVSLAAALGQSLGLMPFVGEPSLSLRGWSGAAAELATSAGASASIAIASTAVALVIGFVLAAHVLTAPRLGRVVAALSAATIPVPHLIGAGSMGLLLSDSGFLDRVLGLPDGFPALVGSPWWVAVIIEYAWKESAFVALVVLGSMSRSMPGMCDSAATLGATAWQRIVHVVLPLSGPALAVSGLIVFVYTIGSYETAWLLGPISPEPLSVRAVRLFGSVDLAARPEAMATALVSVAVGGAAILGGVAVLRARRDLR